MFAFLKQLPCFFCENKNMLVWLQHIIQIKTRSIQITDLSYTAKCQSVYVTPHTCIKSLSPNPFFTGVSIPSNRMQVKGQSVSTVIKNTGIKSIVGTKCSPNNHMCWIKHGVWIKLIVQILKSVIIYSLVIFYTKLSKILILVFHWMEKCSVNILSNMISLVSLVMISRWMDGWSVI